MKRIIFATLTLLFALRAESAMVRVVGIENGRTITIERGGTRVSARLAGVTITDELRARELLRWTIGTSWVMLEASGDEFLAYRSPDALFINRELVLRGFARATLPGIEPENTLAVTYLGEVNPAGPQARATAAPVPRTGSGTRRPPRATPPRRATARSTGASVPNSRGSRGPSPGARTDGPRSPGSSR